MSGDSAVRHCQSCDLNVYNLSDMTEREAEDFLTNSLSSKKVCTTFYRRTDGRIMTDNCPRSLRLVRNVARTTKVKFAALLTFLLSCSCSHAQTLDSEQSRSIQTQKCEPASDINSLRTAPLRTMGALRINPNLDLGPYSAGVRRRLNRSWHPPESYEDKKVTVGFKFNKEGHVSNIRLERSSGVASADQAALKAIQKAARFSSLPVDCQQESIDIQFTFDYNEYSGGKQH